MKGVRTTKITEFQFARIPVGQLKQIKDANEDNEENQEEELDWFSRLLISLGCGMSGDRLHDAPNARSAADILLADSRRRMLLRPPAASGKIGALLFQPTPADASHVNIAILREALVYAIRVSCKLCESDGLVSVQHYLLEGQAQQHGGARFSPEVVSAKAVGQACQPEDDTSERNLE